MMPISMIFQSQFQDTRCAVLGWFGGDSSANADVIIYDAFERAKAYVAEELPEQDRKAIFLEQPVSMADFMSILLQARSKHGGGSRTIKTSTWLERLSSRVVYYGKVLDVLAQHHPEYVSLAWGAFRFLFVAVLNHEELVKQLAKACSRIAEALPRADLSLVLYPTSAMKEAVARLYASIMGFIVRALRWYRKSRIAYFLSSITKPWALEFEQELREVEEHGRSVEELSQSSSRAELRETRTQIHLTRSDLEAARVEIRQLSTVVEDRFQRLTEFALASRSLQLKMSTDIADSKIMISHVQLAQVLSLSFMESLPTSGQCFAHCRSYWLRRQAARRNHSVCLPGPGAVEEWKNEESLSFLVTRNKSPIHAKDFLIDIIGLLRRHGLPVLWALRPPNLRNSSLTTLDVIRMLLYQALQINNCALNTSHPITIAQLRDASSHDDWLELLKRALQGSPTTYIIFDSDLIDYVTNGDNVLATKFLTQFAKFLDPKAAKFIVSSYSFEVRHAEQDLGVNAVLEVKAEDTRSGILSRKRSRFQTSRGSSGVSHGRGKKLK